MPIEAYECGLTVFLFPNDFLDFGFHKRRAAQIKVIIVIIKLTKHFDYSSLMIY